MPPHGDQAAQTDGMRDHGDMGLRLVPRGWGSLLSASLSWWRTMGRGFAPGACGLLAVLFPKPTNQRIVGCRARRFAASHKIRLHCTITPVIMFGMATHRHRKEDERRILRCAACDGTVFAEITGRADANTACASCGMTMVDSPFSGGDYFDVIMRVGRPRARLRRAG